MASAASDDPGEDQPSIVTSFVKRKNRRANVRKRQREDEEDEEQGGVALSALERAKEAKKRSRGLLVDEDSAGLLVGKGSLALDEASPDRGVGARNDVGANWSAATGTNVNPMGSEHAAAIEAQKSAFVRERLADMGLAQQSSAASAESSSRPAGSELFALPERVREAMERGKAEGVAKLISEADAKALGIDMATLESARARALAATSTRAAEQEAQNDGTAQGGMLAWNTGLAEVVLPVEFKLRNIAETEVARRKLMKRMEREQAELEMQHRSGASEMLHSRAAPSFNASFAAHGRAAVAKSRVQSLRAQLFSLRDELERAQAIGNVAEAARVQAEMDSVGQSLRSAMGAGDGMALTMSEGAATDDEAVRKFLSGSSRDQ
jgi:hypothetical protein